MGQVSSRYLYMWLAKHCLDYVFRCGPIDASHVIFENLVQLELLLAIRVLVLVGIRGDT